MEFDRVSLHNPLLLKMARILALASNKTGKRMYTIKTYNQISNRGLSRFPTSDYTVSGEATEADAIMLRSHKLSIDEVGSSRAVARAGAGTNNVPVADCTERGVVVFNTPGANANAVKELVLCGLLSPHAASSRASLSPSHRRT